MDLIQDNFESAVRSGEPTIIRLYGLHPSQIVLADEPQSALETMAWDLEAIQAAIRMELNRRSERPVDLA